MEDTGELPADWEERRPWRAEGLEIEPAGDGCVVYQPERDRVHYLNHTAALLLELATGEATGGELGAFLAQAYSLPEPPRDDVAAGLAELLREGLVTWEPGRPGSAP